MYRGKTDGSGDPKEILANVSMPSDIFFDLEDEIVYYLSNNTDLYKYEDDETTVIRSGFESATSLVQFKKNLVVADSDSGIFVLTENSGQYSEYSTLNMTGVRAVTYFESDTAQIVAGILSGVATLFVLISF